MINEQKCLEELIEFSFREVSVKQFPRSLEKSSVEKSPTENVPMEWGPKEPPDGSKQGNHREFSILEEWVSKYSKLKTASEESFSSMENGEQVHRFQ